LWQPIAAHAQSAQELEGLRKELEALREGQAAIRKQLDELTSLLRGRQAARPSEPPNAVVANAVVAVDGAPFLGDKSAALTLIEFSDLQCPFCARHARETFPQIERDYIRTGKVKYVLRDFPLESIHPQAFKGHEATRCAGEQGKYWEMHARLLADQKSLSPNDLTEHARTLGLDVPSFQLCLDSGKYAAGIRTDLAEGSKAGVSGTPSFFLGVSDPNDSKVKVLKVIVGAQPFANFKEAIDSLLPPSPQTK